jgi:hypothetical protein
MAIFSLNLNQNNGVPNNADCLGRVGLEPANFAFITKNGKPHAPADPLLSTIDTFTPHKSTDLFMQSGDQLAVSIHDNRRRALTWPTYPRGQLRLDDRQRGQRVRSDIYDPERHDLQHPAVCVPPHVLHLQRAHAGPRAAHGCNVAFSDEIGHFSTTTPSTPRAATASPPASPAPTTASASAGPPACACTWAAVWPRKATSTAPPTRRFGRGRPPSQDANLHLTAVQFTSPVFNGIQHYQRVRSGPTYRGSRRPT